MPPEGLDWLPVEETLTDAEVVRLVRIGVEQLGIRQVRFTGGGAPARRGPPPAHCAGGRCRCCAEASRRLLRSVPSL